MSSFHRASLIKQAPVAAWLGSSAHARQRLAALSASSGTPGGAGPGPEPGRGPGPGPLSARMLYAEDLVFGELVGRMPNITVAALALGRSQNLDEARGDEAHVEAAPKCYARLGSAAVLKRKKGACLSPEAPRPAPELGCLRLPRVSASLGQMAIGVALTYPHFNLVVLLHATCFNAGLDAASLRTGVLSRWRTPESVSPRQALVHKVDAIDQWARVEQMVKCCADTYIPGPPYCTYMHMHMCMCMHMRMRMCMCMCMCMCMLHVPASRVLYDAKWHRAACSGRPLLYVRRTRTSPGRTVRTA